MTEPRTQQRSKIKVVIHGMFRAGFRFEPVTAGLEVGALVRNPQQPAWGRGQVQSIIGSRITVNFENAGKVVINAEIVTLTPVAPDWI